MIPRPYQVEAVAAARHALADRGNALLALPTGAGKSALAGFIVAEEASDDPRSRFLVLQHRDELLTQNCAAITSITGLPSSVVKAERDDWSGRIIFASQQTLARQRRRENMVPVSHIIIDEAHHVEAESYKQIIGHARTLRPDVKLIGMSATPERADGRGLCRTFSGIAYSISIGSLIEQGILAKPRALTIDIANAELAGLSIEAGEYDMDEADELLNQSVHNDAVVEHWRAHASGRRTIGFCTKIDHAQAVADAFRAANISAAHISSETPTKERADIISRFDRGEIQVLTNCMLLTEGFDSQPVSCVLILRPMLHRSTFIQAVGRGLRCVNPERYPGIIKTDCLVLDFAGTAHRHGSIEAMLGLQDAKGRPRSAFATDDATEAGEEDDDAQAATPLRHVNMSAIELLGRSPFAWEPLLGDPDRRIASGFDAWAGVFTADDDLWIAVGKARGSRLKTLSVGTETQAIAAADDYLRANETSDAAKKSRRWLRERATEKQIELLASQDVRQSYVTKYEAACLLNWAWNRPAIQRAIAGACP